MELYTLFHFYGTCKKLSLSETNEIDFKLKVPPPLHAHTHGLGLCQHPQSLLNQNLYSTASHISLICRYLMHDAIANGTY